MTRRQMLTALFGAAVLALPVAGCGHQPVQDEPGAELILRYAENQPEDYPTTQAALAFADLVAQRTDGRVKVLVYSGGEVCPAGRIDRPHPAGISPTAKPGKDGQRNQENRIKNRQSAVCSEPQRGEHPALCFSIEYRNVSIC